MNEGTTKDAAEPPPSSSTVSRQPPARGDIGALLSQFVQEIDSLADTLPLAMQSISAATKRLDQDLTKFAKEHSRGNFDAFRNDAHRFLALSRRAGSAVSAYALVPASFLVTLVSQYDAFLGRLIEALLLARPEVLNSSEKTFSFSELLKFGSVDAARDHIIEKEVESVLRKSHPEQFDWLEKKFEVQLRKDLSVWSRFVELTERRNLFVHTGGHVSSQYLENCKAHKVDTTSLSRGQVLGVDNAYFKEAHGAILEIGVKLAQVLWRKLKPGDLAAADQTLVSVTYALLVEEKYDLAKPLLDFSTEVLKRHSSSEQRLTLVVNRVLAYKWSGGSQRASEILEKEDFSALSDRFKLAEAALRDDLPRVIVLVRQIGPKSGVRLGDYRDWPLFREVRKQSEFQGAVSETFGEPFVKAEISPLDGSEPASAAMRESPAEVDAAPSQSQGCSGATPSGEKAGHSGEGA